MSEHNSAVTTAKPSKKEVRHEIEQKIANALSDVSKTLDAKKFKKYIKKASKILREGISAAGAPAVKDVKLAKKPAKTAVKQAAGKKAANKKAAVKKAAPAKPAVKKPAAKKTGKEEVKA